jgi:hypothetical protein
LDPSMKVPNDGHAKGDIHTLWSKCITDYLLTIRAVKNAAAQPNTFTVE